MGDGGAGGAGARPGRPRGGGAWRSLLSAQEFAALESVGFDPVGDVLGTVVAHAGYVSAGGRSRGRSRNAWRPAATGSSA
jgi:hypothetical protein